MDMGDAAFLKTINRSFVRLFAPVENISLARIYPMVKNISPQKKQEPARKINEGPGE